MKPWPKEVREHFPLPPDALPERPWWRLVQVGVATWWVRQGPCAPGAAPYRIHTDAPARAMADAAVYDRVHPLPHPGFRVGQVWMLAMRDSEDDPAPLWQAASIVFDSDPTHLLGARARRWRLGSGEDVDDEEMHGWFDTDAYLVADPACPWLAPWSPVEAAKL